MENRVLFGTWLASIRARERDSGVSHRDLACDPLKLTPYVQGQLAEALQSLERLYATLPPVVTEESEQREAWETLRDSYVLTVREALDRIGATLTAVGCTDRELSGVLDPPEPEPAPEPETVTDEEDQGGEDAPLGSNDETAEMPVPKWVKMGRGRASVSPTDVPVGVKV